jgi:hypothetical protein
MIAFYEDRAFPAVLKAVNFLSPTGTIRFFGRCPSPKIKNTTFRKPALLVSSGKEAPQLVDFVDRAVRIHCVPHKHSAS